MPVRDARRGVLADGAAFAGVVILGLMFLGVAAWNGFPLFFFDTGGYLAQGLGGAFLPERSPVYSLLLFASFGSHSLWWVVVFQSLMAAFLVVELARAEVPGVTLLGLTGIGAALCLLTGIAWYTGQVEPDIMTPLLVLGCYLMMFRGAATGRVRRVLVFAATALCIACHPSHLGLMGGLLIAAILLLALRRFLPFLPRPRVTGGFLSLLLALGLILAANYGYTRQFFITRTGPSFVFARLMQDGIVKRVLDDDCPQAHYRLCAFRRHLATHVDAWLWGPGSGFHVLGGFANLKQQDEYGRIIAESLRRYPLLHLRAAIYDSALQFLLFKTGDGIEPQMDVLETSLRDVIPRQMPAYLAARQQRGLLGFKTLNLLHVPMGVLGILGLLLLLNHAVRRGRWQDTKLPALVLLALVGNAIICGTFAEPHDRYQSRLIWLPVLVVMLARMRDPRAFQPVEQGI